MAQRNALRQILLNANDMDPRNEAIRSQALAQIQEAEKASAQDYVGSLMTELADESAGAETRQLAGILLKNFMNSRDATTAEEKSARWLAIKTDVRDQIKQMTLQTLQSPEKLARNPAASVAVAIASIELPVEQWLDFVPRLCEAGQNKENQFARESAIKCLGYLCEDCPNHDVLLKYAQQIVTVIVNAMSEEPVNPTVRMEATKALCNSCEFMSDVMEQKGHRDYLMSVIYKCVQIEEEPVADMQTRVYGMQCLVKFVELYYGKLVDYMVALFKVTLYAVQKDDEEVGLQGLEFWATMCETEQYLIDNPKEQEGDMVCKYYVKGATPRLVPVVWECLLKQEEGASFTEYNLCFAAGHLLQSLAATICDDVVEPVMTLVNAHVASPNWREAEAALHAFGSILDGPSPNGPLAPQVQGAVDQLLNIVRTAQRPIVKHTATWCVGRIAKFFDKLVISNFLEPVLNTMVGALQDPNPELGVYACFAIHNVAEGCGRGMNDNEEENALLNYQPSNALSPYFMHLASPLYKVATSTQDNNLRTEAWSALTSCVSASAGDCAQNLILLLQDFLTHLENFNVHAAQAQGEEQLRTVNTMQEMSCALVQTILRKFRFPENRGQVAPHADRIMMCLLAILKNPHSSVETEALMAVGALGEAVQDGFAKYIDAFAEPLMRGLRNQSAVSVCMIALNTFGEILPYIVCPQAPQGMTLIQQVVLALLENLNSRELDNNIKPKIISMFGDIALNIEDKFMPFLEMVLEVVTAATQLVQTEVDKHKQGDEQDKETWMEYQDVLREEVCACYTGVLVGLRSCMKSANDFAKKILQQVLIEVESIAKDRNRIQENLTQVVLELMCDIVDTFGSQTKQMMMQNGEISQMVMLSMRSADSDVVKAAKQFEHC